MASMAATEGASFLPVPIARGFLRRPGRCRAIGLRRNIVYRQKLDGYLEYRRTAVFAEIRDGDLQQSVLVSVFTAEQPRRRGHPFRVNCRASRPFSACKANAR